MRFTFPILTLCIGGAQRVLAEVTNGLVNLGHDVTILMPLQGEIEYPIRAKIVRTPEPVIHSHDYPDGDVIVSNYYTTVPSAAAASANGKGMHVRFSLCYEPTFLPDNHVTFNTYHLTDKVVVLSRWQQQIVDLNHGIKGCIVPVGVSSIFHNAKVREHRSRIHITAIVRNAEGTWSWHRGQPYLIAELERVRRERPNIIINLICPRKELALSPTLQNLRDQGHFLFHSPETDEELCHVYNQTDIFVSSSVYDSASIPGLEAMKCGAAVVATYSGGNSDYCNHMENCLLSYRYEERLAGDVMRLIDDPPLRQQLAHAGEMEAGKWTWQRTVQQFDSAMHHFLNS